VKSNWQNVTLDTLCIIARGGSPRPIKKYLTESPEGVNWIKIADATASSKYIYKTKQKIKACGIPRSRLVQEGDFLLSNSMSFGRPYIMRTQGCIHDGWLLLRDKSGLFEQDYLFYFLGSKAAYNQFEARAKGSTVRNLNISLVKSVEVPLPPLPEQKRIVEILDEAFEAIDKAIANTEKNIKNAQELYDNKLQNVFVSKGADWITMQLSQVVEIRSGRGYKKVIAPNGKYPILGSAGRAIGFTDSYICEGGTTIVGRKGNINSPIFVETKFWNVDTAFGFHALEPIDRIFLFLFCLYFDFSKLDKGSGRPSLVKKDLLSIQVPIPPKHEQKKIAAKLNRVSMETKNLVSVYKQRLSKLSDLKQSILQKAFTGELTKDFEAIDKALSEAGV